MPPLCWYLRPSLLPHSQRLTLASPPHNEQTQRRLDTSLSGRIPRRGCHKRCGAIRWHTRRKSCVQWYHRLWADREPTKVLSEQRQFLRRCVTQWHQVRDAKPGRIAGAESETVHIEAAV